MKSPSNILGKLEALLKLLSTAVYFFNNYSPSKTMKNFLFHLRSSFFWRYSNSCNFFSFCTSLIQWCHERTGLHKLTDVIFGKNSKPFYIAYYYITNRGFFLELSVYRFFNNPLSEYLIFKTISSIQWLFWVIYQN